MPDEGGAMELDLFGYVKAPGANKEGEPAGPTYPRYVNSISETLEGILTHANVSLWLMVDRLDEIFPRRSVVERKALRGLLRSMHYFSSERVRVKLFLRDDMLDQIVNAGEGFTALTHVTVRQSDTLRWTPEQIETMVVKRLIANAELAEYLSIDVGKIDASSSYRTECFKKIFPPTVFRGPKQSSTLGWIYSRCADGRNVVTPRDVLDLLIRAKQRQEDLCSNDPDGVSEWIIGSAAIRYGFEELSKRKRQTYLQAEFPHLWSKMEKFIGGKTEYSADALAALLGSDWRAISGDLVAIGFMTGRTTHSGELFSIPRLYRHSMELTQGKAS